MPLLGPGESALLTERTESGSGRDGVLTLTTSRLVFEAKRKQGLVHQLVRGEQLATLVDLRLDQISNIHRDKPLLGRASLRVDALGKSFRFLVRDAEVWMSGIAQARQRVPPTGYPGAPVIVNVQAAAPQAPVQAFLHCRFCGALAPAGSLGPGMRCPSCGAAL
jgi:hypothetical protein